MSFFEDNIHLLDGTDWYDADAGSNYAFIRRKLGLNRGIPSPETLTPRERIARGQGTPADFEILNENEKAHKDWLATDDGKRFLERLNNGFCGPCPAANR